MDAGFGWLIFNHNFARILATLVGILGVASLIENVQIYFSGPPRLDTPFMPLYRYGLAFCWHDPNPTSGFLLSIALLTISITGMVLVWLRPRLGFFISANGWVVLWSSSFLHSHDADDKLVYDWRLFTIILVVLLWLLFAAVRVRTKKSSVPLTN